VLGATNAVVNSLLNAVLGTVVPTDMRGKVFSLIGTIAGGLMPIAYALGGGLAEVFPVRIVMAAAFSLTLLCFLPTIASGPVRRLVGYNPEFDTLETIR
jgi:MFS family permease